MSRARWAGGAAALAFGAVALAGSGSAGAVVSKTLRPAAANLTFPVYETSLLACASSKTCVGIGVKGARETFNPIHGGKVTTGKTDPLGTYFGVTCASAHTCVAVDDQGAVEVFDPWRGGAPSSSFTVGNAQVQTAISCPGAHRCVVETYGGEAVFDPTHPGTPSTSSFSANGNGGNASISCPALALCVGSNGNSGLVYSYDPSNPGVAQVTTFTSSPEVGGLSCPSRKFCVALASPANNPAVNTGIITFNPASPGNPKVTLIAQASLSFVTCASTTLCAAAGGNDAVIIFDPHHPRRERTVYLPSSLDVTPSPDAAGIAFIDRTDLVVLSQSGRKAVFNAAKPPKRVALTALGKATKVAHR